MDFIEDTVVADTEPIRVLTASELPGGRGFSAINPMALTMRGILCLSIALSS
jgi:hypothetical protein